MIPHDNGAISIHWLEVNILKVVYRDDVEIVIDDAVGLIDYLRDTVQSNPDVKVLSVVGKYTSITPQAREYIEKARTGIKSEAIIVKSLPQKIIVDFYMNIAQQDHPVKIFKEEAEGVAWLNSL